MQVKNYTKARASGILPETAEKDLVALQTAMATSSRGVQDKGVFVAHGQVGVMGARAPSCHCLLCTTLWGKLEAAKRTET